MRHIVTFFKIILLLALIAYLGYAFFNIMQKSTDEACQTVCIQIKDSLQASFVTAADVEKKLIAAHLYPQGQLMDSIHGCAIERCLTKYPFIQKATCYKTPGGFANIIVEQRIPVLRVMASNGDDYYMDENGYRMKPDGYEADLVVVTGQVEEAYARKYLVPLGILIRNDAFWNSQIEQINITPQRELELFMRIGDQTIHAGTVTNIGKKLAKLRTFYEKVMPQVGWNLYKDINIAFDNQVVCKKPTAANV